MSRTRVLLCDDTKDILLLLSLEFGFDPEVDVVGTAENGVQAIELAGRFQPDVVVLDLAMPVMDGLEALPEIHRVSPDTKVVVLSGFDAAAMASQALALGAIRYLEKGTSASEIVQVVKEVAEEGTEEEEGPEDEDAPRPNFLKLVAHEFARSRASRPSLGLAIVGGPQA